MTPQDHAFHRRTRRVRDRKEAADAASIWTRAASPGETFEEAGPSLRATVKRR
jgi:hypothetical protein